MPMGDEMPHTHIRINTVTQAATRLTHTHTTTHTLGYTT